MKQAYLPTLTLLLGLLVVPASADPTSVLIDDFTVAAPTVTENTFTSSSVTINGTESQRLIEGGESGSVEAITDGSGVFQLAGANGGTLLLSYTSFLINNPSLNTLSLTFPLTTNVDMFTLELTSTNGAEPIGDLFSIPDIGESGPETFQVDLTTLGGYSPTFMSGVNGLNLVFSSSSQVFDLQLTNVSLQAVPEPSVVSLLVFGGLGLAVFFLRRRTSACA